MQKFMNTEIMVNSNFFFFHINLLMYTYSLFLFKLYNHILKTIKLALFELTGYVTNNERQIKKIVIERNNITEIHINVINHQKTVVMNLPLE